MCPWAADRLPAGVFLNLTKGPKRSVTPQVIAGFQGSRGGVRVRESRPNGTRVGHDAAVTGSVSSDHRATTDRTARCSRTLYAVGIDVSAAYVAGVSQATWWLSTEEARQLCHDLGAKLLPTVEGGERP